MKWILSISERDRRTLSIGTIVIAAMLVGFKGIPAAHSWTQDAQASADELQLSLAKARRATSNRWMKDSLNARFNRYMALAPSLVRGNAAPQAAGNLAGIISEMAEGSGVQLGTVQLDPDSQVIDGLIRVRLRADASGDVHSLMAFLSTIETSNTPLLAIRALTVNQSDPTAPSNRPEMLQANMVVEGLARGDNAP